MRAVPRHPRGSNLFCKRDLVCFSEGKAKSEQHYPRAGSRGYKLPKYPRVPRVPVTLGRGKAPRRSHSRVASLHQFRSFIISVCNALSRQSGPRAGRCRCPACTYVYCYRCDLNCFFTFLHLVTVPNEERLHARLLFMLVPRVRPEFVSTASRR